MIEPAYRLRNLSENAFGSISQQISGLQAQGHQIIRLDVGVPDGMPPPSVIDTLATSVRQAHVHGYSGSAGTRAFRVAVAEHYARRFQVNLDPDTQVLPLLGSKEGLINISLAYLNPGDMAFIPDPSYPAYGRGIQLADGEICYMPLRRENSFLPDLEAINQIDAERARMLWINYPNNPTGAIADQSYFQQVVDFCNTNDILLVSDNPYVELTFDGYGAGSALQAADAFQCCIEFMTFSKSYNMAGWRLGAVVGNPAAIKMLARLKGTVDAGHLISVYDAGIAALEQTTDDWMQTHRQTYQRRRDWVMEALPLIGLSANSPQGSMFIWAKVEDGTGQNYAEAALKNAHVAVMPGQAFGPESGRFVRISLGMQDEKLQLALEWLEDWYSAS